MFIALITPQHCAPTERHVSLVTECYKHIAPPEQRASPPVKTPGFILLGWRRCMNIARSVRSSKHRSSSRGRRCRWQRGYRLS